MAVDLRLDVLERHILAQGKTPEAWAVEVAEPLAGIWTTTFYVGVQSFRLADSQETDGCTGEDAKKHCMFIGRQFVKALRAMLEMEKTREQT